MRTGLPRFTVGTLTGFPITEGTLNSRSRAKERTIAYVLDAHWNFEVVWEFPYGLDGQTAEQTAQGFADRLNEEYAA